MHIEQFCKEVHSIQFEGHSKIIFLFYLSKAVSKRLNSIRFGRGSCY